jgi:dimethylaniline monooxygenase (N-oxide forming)
MSEYFRTYAKHNNLYEHIVFGTTVESLKRDRDSARWLISIQGEATPRSFDKVVWASGTELNPRYPDIKGLDDFTGTFIHGQAFKGPESFRGKSVVVLGMANTACDVAVVSYPRDSGYRSVKRVLIRRIL